MSDLKDSINEIIVRKLDLKEKKISEDASLFEDLGVDSIDIIELIIAFEVKFSIEIPDEDIVNLKNIGDLYKYIQGKVNNRES